MKDLTLIGRAERADFPELSFHRIPAKVDTGADASSIWAHSIVVSGKTLEVVFFGPESPYYDGRVHTFSQNQYTITRVSSSFGHREVRYKLKLKIRIKKRIINGSFTLADRSTKLYPVLLGRSLLKNKFIVDVAKGSPLIKEERARRVQLQEELVKLKEDLK